MRPALLAILCVLLSACSVTGIDASSEFGCKTPKGLSCVSVSETYKLAQAGQLPAERSTGDPQGTGEQRNGSGKAEPGAKRVGQPYSDRPLPNVQFTTPAPVATATAAAPGAASKLSPAAFNAPTTGTPLRTPERVLRIWLAPFQDVDGDLHDQRYVYVTVTPGQWTLESSRAEIKKRYQPVRMVGRSEAQSPTSSTAAEGTNVRPALPIGTPVPTQIGSPTATRNEDR